MENLGAMAYLRYIGFREITDRNVLELHCIYNTSINLLNNIYNIKQEIIYDILS